MDAAKPANEAATLLSRSAELEALPERAIDGEVAISLKIPGFHHQHLRVTAVDRQRGAELLDRHATATPWANAALAVCYSVGFGFHLQLLPALVADRESGHLGALLGCI